MVEALYRRIEGSTNFRRIYNPATVSMEDWQRNGLSSGEMLIWLRGRGSSFREELSGLEVNELAGRVVVDEPATTRRRSMLSCECVNPNLCDHGRIIPT